MDASPLRTPMTEHILLSPEEARAEAALRDRFATFWATTQGTPREVYDLFIGHCPIVEGFAFEAVDEAGVQGWWARKAGAPADQVLLFIHGGGYGLGSAQAYRGFASQIGSRTGRSVFILDYPRAPEAVIPAAPTAALAAYRWLERQGFSAIAIAGDSAGGGLSLVTLAQAVGGAGTRPLGAAVFSPWTDMTLSGASSNDPSVVDPLIGRDYLVQCAAQYLGPASPLDPLASPLWGGLAGLPPLLIQVGADEILRDDAVRYAEAAAKAGVDVRLEVWEGLHHVFQLDVGPLASARAALDRAAAFLKGLFPVA